MEVMKCPKCGTEQPEAKECRKCGIVIAKYRSSSSAQPKQAASPKQKRSFSPVRLLLVLAVLVLSTAGYYGWQWYQAGQERKRIAAAEAADRAAMQPLEKLLRQCDAGFQSGVRYEDFSRVVTDARAELETIKPTITRLTERFNALVAIYNDYQTVKSLWTAYLKFDSVAFATAIIDISDPDIMGEDFAICQDPQQDADMRDSCWTWLRLRFVGRANERLAALP